MDVLALHRLLRSRLRAKTPDELVHELAPGPVPLSTPGPLLWLGPVLLHVGSLGGPALEWHHYTSPPQSNSTPHSPTHMYISGYPPTGGALRALAPHGTHGVPPQGGGLRRAWHGPARAAGRGPTPADGRPGRAHDTGDPRWGRGVETDDRTRARLAVTVRRPRAGRAGPGPGPGPGPTGPPASADRATSTTAATATDGAIVTSTAATPGDSATSADSATAPATPATPASTMSRAPRRGAGTSTTGEGATTTGEGATAGASTTGAGVPTGAGNGNASCTARTDRRGRRTRVTGTIGAGASTGRARGAKSDNWEAIPKR